MRGDDPLVHGLDLRTGRFQIHAGSEPPEDLRHPMLAAGDHRCRHVMGAGHDIGDHFGFGRVRHGRFQHADNGGQTRAEADRLADDRRIAFERRHPEPMREHRRPRRIRAIVAGIEQTAQDRTQSHDVEVRTADHAGADLVRVAEPDHREGYG